MGGLTLLALGADPAARRPRAAAAAQLEPRPRAHHTDHGAAGGLDAAAGRRRADPRRDRARGGRVTALVAAGQPDDHRGAGHPGPGQPTRDARPCGRRAGSDRRPGSGGERPRHRGPASRSLLDEQLLAQLGQGAGQQPGDVHLGDADLLRDLRLGHVAEEAQQQDPLLARRQVLQQRLERLPVLDALQRLVLGAERVRDRRGLVVRVRDVQGQRAVGVGGLQALQDLLLGDAQALGQLVDRGGAAVLLGELRRRRGQRRAAAPGGGAAPAPPSPCRGSGA